MPALEQTDATVLVVDDEPDITDLYRSYLGADYDIRHAHDGNAAIKRLDDDVDVVLLDRRMPKTPASGVLAAIEERDLTPRVALVTAVAPDFDIIDLGIDDYLVKPVTRSEVQNTVERLLLIDAYSEHRRELSSLRVKRNVLQVEKSEAELAASKEYQELCDDIDRLESTVAELTDSLDGEALERYG